MNTKTMIGNSTKRIGDFRKNENNRKEVERQSLFSYILLNLFALKKLGKGKREICI